MSEVASDVAAQWSAEVLASALGYAARGWPVFPLHTVWGGRCTCGRSDCDRAGKHPRTRDGLTSASVDETKVRAWWKRWPLSNVAVRTGDGLMVLDVDVDKGGDESLEALLEEQGKLGDTLCVCTGGGGYHWYWRVDGEVPCSVSAVADGLDVRGDGGYVVAPPSRHHSGGVYEWEGCVAAEDGEGEVAACPPWLVDICRSAKSTGGRRGDGEADPWKANAFIGDRRNNALTSMGGTMRRRAASEEAILVALTVLNAERCRPPLGDAEVGRISASVARYDPDDPILGTVERDGQAVDGKGSEDWRRALVLDDKGKLRPLAGNAALILSHLDEWDGVVGYNAYTNEVEWLREPPIIGLGGFPAPKPGPCREGHGLYVQQWLAKRYGTRFARDGLWLAMEESARSHEYHPVRDWLESLRWDGTVRLASRAGPEPSEGGADGEPCGEPGWLTTYLGVTDGDYAREVGRAWMVSAVARIMRPGCQADHVLVLEGWQGAGKSSAMRTLFGDAWFLDCLPDIRQKDALMALRGKWGIEVPELDSFRGAAETRIKSFISQRWDEYRPAYGRKVVRYPRQCVIVATTNEKRWLTDPTGGRRFWPVTVGGAGGVDREGLERDREQLWAEAVTRYESNEKWWPEGLHKPLAVALADAQDARYAGDIWEDIIRAWIGVRIAVEAERVFTEALGIEKGRITRGDQTRIGAIMGRIGYERTRRRVEGRRRVFYVRRGEEVVGGIEKIMGVER